MVRVPTPYSGNGLAAGRRQLVNAVRGVGRSVYRQAVEQFRESRRRNRVNNQLNAVLGHDRPTARPVSGTTGGGAAGATQVKVKPNVVSKRYSRVKRRKVAVKKLKGKLVGFVKDVVKCQENSGVYKKVVAGDQTIKLGTTDSLNGSKILWTGFNNQQNNTTPYTEDALKFTPLSAKRILDAVSVLYNGKTAAVNFEKSTGNFDAKELKVEVQYASYRLELTNHSESTAWVTCYEVMAKDNSQIDFINSAANIISSGTFDFSSSPALFQFQPPSSLTGQYKMPINMNFSDIKGLEKLYHIKKLSKKLVKPGRSYVYKCSEKDFCVEMYKKTFTSTDNQGGTGGTGPIAALATYPKGERQLIFQFDPLPTIALGTNYSTAALCAGVYDKRFIWAVRTDEYYKITQPRNTIDAQAGNKIKLLQGTAVPGDATNTIGKYSLGFETTQSPVYG